MNKEELQRKVAELGPWHYCHILPYGVSTGSSPVQVESEKLQLLVDAGVFPDPVYERVMDLGANSGLISMWFADHKGSTVTAVEAGTKFYPQLEFAVEVKGYAGRVFPVNADVTEPFLDEYNGEYDLVLNLGMMHHIAVPKHSVVYDMMLAALKPGGLVVVQTKTDQFVMQRLRSAGFRDIKQVTGYAQGDRLAWTAMK
jgi:precorrin-6B methylase 2